MLMGGGQFLIPDYLAALDKEVDQSRHFAGIMKEADCLVADGGVVDKVKSKAF